MARKKGSSYKDKIGRLTLGLFNTLTDVCLFTVFFHLQSYQVYYGKRSVGEAINQAAHLTKIVHANNLDRLLYRLKSKGYLERKKDYLKITKLGRKKLNMVLPQYEKKRPWDGKLYLITYDIPEKKKRERDYLRDYIKKLGCGRLQYSVWLTPYNPKSLIVEFIKKRQLAGLVLVSELKEGSGIGGNDILTVIAKVYRLDELNQKYREFVKRVENNKLTGSRLIMAYLSILKKDPQLPFELLPPNWWGEEAYCLYQKETEKIRRKLE